MGNCCNPIKEYDNIEDNNEIWSFHEECCICMENPIQAAILKCGHLKFCIKCAKELTYNDNPNLRCCPLCRTPIKGYTTFNPRFFYK